MESVKRSSSSSSSSVTPNKNRLVHSLSKVLHIRATTGIAPDDGVTPKVKPPIEFKKGRYKNPEFPSKTDDKVIPDKELKKGRAKNPEVPSKIKEEGVSGQVKSRKELKKSDEIRCKEAFVAKLFAGISGIKAAYVQLQYYQTPYDPDGIQSSDNMIVSELRTLSEMKHCYSKTKLDVSSPEKTELLAEIQEQKNLVKTYEVMSTKLECQAKLKDSEITFLKEKLEEINKENNLLEKRLSSAGSLPRGLQTTGSSHGHFIERVKQMVKSVRSFVRMFTTEIESAGWDLDAAACSIEPGIVLWKPNHRYFAFESFVCRHIFEGFNHPEFAIPESPGDQDSHLERFKELSSVKALDFLSQKPDSRFASFATDKYFRIIHPKLEETINGNLDQRNLINSGEFPVTPFMHKFTDMCRRVWLLHCLAFSFNPEVQIFQVKKGSRFSEVYMESVNDEAFIVPSDGSPETDPWVAFTVVPGFNVHKTVVQCQVYLR